MKQLHDMNVRTGLVSNTDVRMRTWEAISLRCLALYPLAVGAVLADLGVLPLLNPILLSEEEGVEKPSSEIFRRACERAGVTTKEIMHVGDELKA